MANNVAEGFLSLLSGAADEYVGIQRQKRAEASRSRLLNEQAGINTAAQDRSFAQQQELLKQQDEVARARSADTIQEKKKLIDDQRKLLNDPEALIQTGLGKLSFAGIAAYADAIKAGKRPTEAARIAQKADEQARAIPADPAAARKQMVDVLSKFIAATDPEALPFVLETAANPNVPISNILTVAERQRAFQKAGITDPNAAVGDGATVQKAINNVFKLRDFTEKPQLFHKGEQLTWDEVYGRLNTQFNPKEIRTILASLGVELTRVKRVAAPKGNAARDFGEIFRSTLPRLRSTLPQQTIGLPGGT